MRACLATLVHSRLAQEPRQAATPRQAASRCRRYTGDLLP